MARNRQRNRQQKQYPRLTHPLVRDSVSGELRRASWDEALTRATAGFRAVTAAHGPDAFGMFSCARATNEMNYVAQKFTRVVIGTNNVDSCNRTCHAPSVAGLSAVFGSGGGTSSYGEVEDTDLIVMWGSNARFAHPIFFHHVLKGIRNGARMYAVDPRRTSTAEWAESWLGLNVGTDIPLAHAVGREIIHAGLANRAFIERSTSGFEEYAAHVEPWTLSVAEQVTGVPAEAIRDLAHAYATAERAQLCWTLGITEHHNGTDNVRALINLSLLTGHVGRYGSGLQPLRGQNNVQGGGDMGAIPNRLPGFQDILDPPIRTKFERAWDVVIQPRYGLNLTEMFEAMEAGELRAVYCIGENPAQSEADTEQAVRRLESLEHLVVQDIFLTKTAELADVVLPATAAWCETEGTTTNSERRVQRVRKAVEPPGEAREDIDIICELARRLGHDWKFEGSEEVWNELRAVSPDHFGMTYDRLEEHQGIQWPCPSTDRLEPTYLHGRLWESDSERRGARAPFGPVKHDPPVDLTDDAFPIRLTTGRRLDSYNTGVQSGGFASPLRRGEYVELCPEDAARYRVEAEERVRITSRRGSVVAPVWIEPGLRPGLAFMTMHFPDEVDTNSLTIEANCPIAGTAEFKASAIRIEKIPVTAVRS
ncbi:molybdopterin-dependent oxidoreductase [Streptomyces samsunensis]|uniref:Formate dehydrogenase subunit alpha n=1 Tax=Streptomyces malaysiensis TaxID=92644 RepID=A0A2J7YVP1_STRMQ|nr:MULTISPECIES: molybdopterin-dependent oxidoreductase [Streptomyces]MCQ6246264.1 molybdopterin-dependent oxidoreductase [Streptomyces malaysiensis]NUH41673.1 molybdopterin-dependent oxidoreductase [Streptomyces samsunensis]PNG91969.1 Formate dehydrogenase subunit alpha [Streptomyces malaysiensis]